MACQALGDRCPRCLVCSFPPASGLLPDGVRLLGHYRGSGRNIRSVLDRTVRPTSRPVEVQADPRLCWRQTSQPFPSGHPQTLPHVFDTHPDHLWDNISFVQAHGSHGTFLLELACSRMLGGKNVMSWGTFCWQTRERTNETCEFLPCHSLISKTLVGGNG